MSVVQKFPKDLDWPQVRFEVHYGIRFEQQRAAQVIGFS